MTLVSPKNTEKLDRSWLKGKSPHPLRSFSSSIHPPPSGHVTGNRYHGSHTYLNEALDQRLSRVTIGKSFQS